MKYLNKKKQSKEKFLSKLFEKLNLNKQFENTSNDKRNSTTNNDEEVDIFDFLKADDNPKSLEDEIKKYLNEPKPGYDEILVWWKKTHQYIQDFHMWLKNF